jgi:hypothetical protein
MTSAVHEEVVDNSMESPKRVIAIAIDSSGITYALLIYTLEFSHYAFEWALENIVRPESDQVVLLNVRPHIVPPVLHGGLPLMEIGGTLHATGFTDQDLITTRQMNTLKLNSQTRLSHMICLLNMPRCYWREILNVVALH